MASQLGRRLPPARQSCRKHLRIRNSDSVLSQDENQQVNTTSEGNYFYFKSKKVLTFERALGLLVVVASGRLRWNKLERSVIRHLREENFYFEKVRDQRREKSNKNIVQG